MTESVYLIVEAILFMNENNSGDLYSCYLVSLELDRNPPIPYAFHQKIAHCIHFQLAMCIRYQIHKYIEYPCIHYHQEHHGRHAHSLYLFPDRIQKLLYFQLHFLCKHLLVYVVSALATKNLNQPELAPDM